MFKYGFLGAMLPAASLLVGALMVGIPEASWAGAAFVIGLSAFIGAVCGYYDDKQ